MKVFAIFALILGMSLSAQAQEPQIFNLSKTYRILTIRTISPNGPSETYKEAIRSNTDRTCALVVQMCEMAVGKQCVRIATSLINSESNAAITTYQVECQARQIK